ncbi:hypothetical protein MRB53_040431 [Persea americana]|nr:hypothetical protein MRB53_040431 [Persea americana]
MEMTSRWDISTPNPNGEEFDNLYLDMNGIVHPCSHPEDRPAPKNEDEIMMEIFRYTDRIMAMVRPPQEAEEKERKKQEAIAEIVASGGTPPEDGEKPWDSNVITPGTPFMDILAASLRYWVTYKLNNDPGWKNIKVIISDASVPATHEPHFRVLREDVFFQQNNGGCRNCGARGHMAAECTVVMEKQEPDKMAPPKPFIWLNVAILREYLEVELRAPGANTMWDLERAIDDWVFIIFFVGNDFLPHLPSLDIREGAIDSLVALWKRNLDVQGGYITCDGSMNLKRAQFMLDGLAEQEEEIFVAGKRTRNVKRKERRIEKGAEERQKRARQSIDAQEGSSFPCASR